MLFWSSGSLDLGCLSTMTMILSGSLSWKLRTLATRYSKEYLSLYGLLIYYMGIERKSQMIRVISIYGRGGGSRESSKVGCH